MTIAIKWAMTARVARVHGARLRGQKSKQRPQAHGPMRQGAEDGYEACPTLPSPIRHLHLPGSKGLAAYAMLAIPASFELLAISHWHLHTSAPLEFQ